MDGKFSCWLLEIDLKNDYDKEIGAETHVTHAVT